MRKVHILPLDKINVEISHPVGGEADSTAPDRLRCWETVILKVGELNVAGFSIGYIPEGFQARQVQDGPFVPGPWAWASANAGVIDTNGGTKAELANARSGGRLFVANMGDLIQLGGTFFEIQPDHNRNIKLVKVNPTRNDMIQRAVAVMGNADDQGSRVVSVVCSIALSTSDADADPAIVLKNALSKITRAIAGLRAELKAINA